MQTHMHPGCQRGRTRAFTPHRLSSAAGESSEVHCHQGTVEHETSEMLVSKQKNPVGRGGAGEAATQTLTCPGWEAGV